MLKNILMLNKLVSIVPKSKFLTDRGAAFKDQFEDCT